MVHSWPFYCLVMKLLYKIVIISYAVVLSIYRYNLVSKKWTMKRRIYWCCLLLEVVNSESWNILSLLTSFEVITECHPLNYLQNDNLRASASYGFCKLIFSNFLGFWVLEYFHFFDLGTLNFGNNWKHSV